MVWSGNAAAAADVERRVGRRARIERLLARAALLAPAERALIEQVLDAGRSLRSLARQARTPPRNLQRRFSNAVTRMTRPEFTFLVRSRRGLDAAHRRVGLLVFVRGLSQRRAAIEAGLSLHEVRQAVRAIRTLARL